MKIADCMKRKVFFIPQETHIGQAARIFSKEHIGTLPVVDEQGKPVGIVRLDDLLSLELPDFIHLVADYDFVHDFGAVETTRPTAKALAQPVTSIMQPVMTIDENCGLLRGYATMLQNKINDVPVISKNGELVGIVSLVDIGAAILSMWSKE